MIFNPLDGILIAEAGPARLPVSAMIDATPNLPRKPFDTEAWIAANPRPTSKTTSIALWQRDGKVLIRSEQASLLRETLALTRKLGIAMPTNELARTTEIPLDLVDAWRDGKTVLLSDPHPELATIYPAILAEWDTRIQHAILDHSFGGLLAEPDDYRQATTLTNALVVDDPDKYWQSWAGSALKVARLARHFWGRGAFAMWQARTTTEEASREHV